MWRALRWLIFLALLSVGVGLWVTRPQTVDASAFAALSSDPENGALVFAAMGCASCHTAKDASGAALLVLSGGKRFPSDFGTFIAPNISSDPVFGIGDWSDVEIASAVMKGTGRDGEHLYPAFPYAAYGKAELQDVADMIAYLRTLPADPTPNLEHEVGFPFNIRAALGGWKLLFVRDSWILQGDLDLELNRGRYLVEALGHCSECHTSRNFLGGLQRGRWLAGAPDLSDASGKSRIPNITDGALFWSVAEIANYLDSGFTPEFDSAGGSMVEVIDNISQLSPEDRLAIAAYLKAVPALE